MIITRWICPGTAVKTTDSPREKVGTPRTKQKSFLRNCRGRTFTVSETEVGILRAVVDSFPNQLHVDSGFAVVSPQ